MSTPTPIDTVDRMIARKERLIGRIMDGAALADPRRPSTTQMATDAVRIAEAQGAIEALKEVREELAAPPALAEVTEHRLHCVADVCCYDAVGA